MASSIKFDNQELLSTTYNPQFLKHESSPDIDLNTMDLPHENGSVQISDRTGSKIIAIQGVLIGSSEEDLESKIDAFKELFRRVNKNLDVNWNGGTRRYVASCQNHRFDRDHYHIGFVPWSAEFLAPTGIAEETTETNLVANENFTTQEKTKTGLTFLGSASPLPRLRVANQDTSSTDAKGIEFKNTDTGERLIYTRAAGLPQTTAVEFDCRLKTVGGPTAPANYYGVFPKFTPGAANNLRIRIGDIIAEGWEQGDIGNSSVINIDGSHIISQSFILPFTDATFQGVELYIAKSGSPAGDLSVKIKTSDGNGMPYSTVVAAMVIPKASVNTSFSWVKINAAAAFTLNANTKYWIVCEITGGGDTYYWMNFVPPFVTYKRGGVADYTGGAWVNYPEYCTWFRLLFGGKADLTKTFRLNIDYYKRWL
jgi:hypothetical protein